MKKAICLLLFFASLFVRVEAQFIETSWKQMYREIPEKLNRLLHTKLDVRPDFENSYLYGKAWLTLKPHFYAIDSLTLDAKGMELKKVCCKKAIYNYR